MKSISTLTLLCVIWCSLVLTFSGCGQGDQPGKTKAEIRREHLRNKRIAKEQRRQDINTFMLDDKPSKLSDKRIP